LQELRCHLGEHSFKPFNLLGAQAKLFAEIKIIKRGHASSSLVYLFDKILEVVHACNLQSLDHPVKHESIK
jgi:hypothetical protein